MYKILRMICGIISAVIVAAAIFIFVYASWFWGLVAVAAACAFFGLCVLFKHLQEKQENIISPPPPKGDFITGRVNADDSGNKKSE